MLPDQFRDFLSRRNAITADDLSPKRLDICSIREKKPVTIPNTSLPRPFSVSTNIDLAASTTYATVAVASHRVRSSAHGDEHLPMAPKWSATVRDQHIIDREKISALPLKYRLSIPKCLSNGAEVCLVDRCSVGKSCLLRKPVRAEQTNKRGVL